MSYEILGSNFEAMNRGYVSVDVKELTNKVAIMLLIKYTSRNDNKVAC